MYPLYPGLQPNGEWFDNDYVLRRLNAEIHALEVELTAANKRIADAAEIIRRMISLEPLQYRADLQFKALEALGKE